MFILNLPEITPSKESLFEITKNQRAYCKTPDAQDQELGKRDGRCINKFVIPHYMWYSQTLVENYKNFLKDDVNKEQAIICFKYA